MRAIFISYRREDAEGQAGRLFDDLAMHFGENAVFMDVVGIEPGRDFRRVIDEHVASCGVLLAVIGKNWLDTKDASGRRRLDDPTDFIHLEIASALKRDIPVIPVIVGGANMPRPDQLPPGLVDLAYRNGVELTHARWNSDVQILIKALRPHVESPQKETEGARAESEERISSKAGTVDASPPSDKPGASTPAPITAAPPAKKSLRWIIAASLLTILFVIGGYLWYQKVAGDRIPQAVETDRTPSQASLAAKEAGTAPMKPEAPPKETAPVKTLKKPEVAAKDKSVEAPKEPSIPPPPSKQPQKSVSVPPLDVVKSPQKSAAPKKSIPSAEPVNEPIIAPPSPSKVVVPSESKAPATGGPLRVHCSLSPGSISPGSSAYLTVSVISSSEDRVADASVRVNSTGGSFETTWAPNATGRTDGAGQFRVKWEAPPASEWFATSRPGQSGYDIYVEVNKAGFNSGAGKCRIMVR